MASTIDNPAIEHRAKPPTPGEEIVISGIAGRFPNSDNVKEFGYNLFNKIDMVDDLETRWRHSNVEIPRRMGKVNNLEKFDATFFGVHFKQVRGGKRDELDRVDLTIVILIFVTGPYHGSAVSNPG